MAITTGGKTYKNFAELEAAVMGKKPTTTKAPSKSPQVAPKKTREQMRADARRMESQDLRAMPTPKSLAKPVKTAAQMRIEDKKREAESLRQEQVNRESVLGPSLVDKGIGAVKDWLAGRGEAHEEKVEEKRLKTPAGMRDAEREQEQEDLRQEQIARGAQSEAEKRAARLEDIRQEREDELADLRGEAEQRRTPGYVAWEEEHAQMTLDLRGTEEGQRQLTQKSLDEKGYAEEYGPNWKDALYGPQPKAKKPVTEEGEPFVIDINKQWQDVPWDYPGANINYFTGSDAPEKLKKMVLNAYAEGGHFIIPGNESEGIPPQAVRIDSRRDLLAAVNKLYTIHLASSDDPDAAERATTAARQVMGRWDIELRRIEARLAGNPDINPNYGGMDVDDTVSEVDEGLEEDLALMERDIISEGGDVPWWDDPEHPWADEGDILADEYPETTKAVAAERAAGVDPLRGFTERPQPSPNTFNLGLSSVQQAQNNADPDDPFSWNPFRGDARKGFTMDEGIREWGLPQNMAEAAIATAWISKTKGDLHNIVQIRDPLGNPVWVDMREPDTDLTDADPRYTGLGYQRALSQDISMLEQVESVQAATDQIYASDLDFRFTQGEARLNEYLTEQEQSFMSEHEVNMQSARTTADAMLSQQMHDQKMAQLQQEFADSKEVVMLEQNFEQAKIEAEFKFRGWLEENQMLQQQNAQMLDAAMRKYDIDEASRQAQAQESLKLTELKLQQAQMQFDLFRSLTSDPQMITFMGQHGILEMFSDVIGNQGNLKQISANYINRISGHPIFKGVGAIPNIQEMARKRPDEMQSAFYGTQALTGKSMEDVQAGLRGAAPWQVRSGIPTREIALA